jgi:cysteine desulfurase/selenocysteine lyase
MKNSQNGQKSLSMEDNFFRKDFPFFDEGDFVYLDSGSTAQKPQVVLEAMDEYNKTYCANIHRSAHGLGNRATTKYEQARKIIQNFLGAARPEEVVFTKGATEGINLVAHSYVKKNASSVIITPLEHHSNILPWQIINKPLHVIHTDNNLQINLNHFEQLLVQNPNSFVSLIHTSNAFGLTYPIKDMIALAHKYGAKVLIDASQSCAHIPIDVNDLKADFLVLSAHKAYGPTGTGALYINKDLHQDCLPYQVGGGAISEVFFEYTNYLPIPYMYESGTPNIAGAIGFGAALEYIQNIGFDFIKQHESKTLLYALERLKTLEHIHFYTDPSLMRANVSFNIEGIHHHDLGILLDKQKVQVRVGHHCVQPAMRMLGIEGTLRLSVGLYTNKEDIDKFIKALQRAINMLKDN